MSKQILAGKELRKKLLSGIQQLSDTVSITLGPRGRNVGIHKTWTEPVVLHDGVSVAKEVELKDYFENWGAQIVKQVSQKTAARAGDGTTTSTFLAYKMIEAGFKAIESGRDPVDLKLGMEYALKVAIDYLDEISKPVKNKEEIKQVATLSSANPLIGEKIAEAMDKVGKDGVIHVEESTGMDIQIEYKEGMEFDKGYISSLFQTKEDGEAELESPYILITDEIITDVSALGKFLERFTSETKRREIVIIASDIQGPALDLLTLNKAREAIAPLAVFAPAFAERRKDILEDIATLTGGKVILKNGSIKLEDVQIEHLGRADSVTANNDVTKIVGTFGSPDKIEKRANQIKTKIEKENSEYEKEQLKERLAKLVSGAAIIKVGALTEVEMKDTKERVIDAVEATKVASLEGIVSGGGTTLLKLSDKIKEELTFDKVDSFEVYEGAKIVMNALREPINKLLTNAGTDLNVIKSLDYKNDYGYDVVGRKIGNMIDMGIIDPTRVIKEAVQNSISVAGMILITESVIGPDESIPTKNIQD